MDEGGGVAKPDFQPLLAAGYHTMAWPEIVATCLTPFSGSSTRPTLVTQLEQFVAELRRMGLQGVLWLDGSFVTDKHDPGDVDLVYVPDLACLPQMQAHAVRLHTLFEQLGAKAIYNCHAFIVHPQNTDQLAYWRGLFGFCHDEVTPKGMIVLTL